MSDYSPLLTRRRRYTLLALMILLACGYLLTYAGDIESGDTLALFDLTASQSRFGDNRLALSAWFWQPGTQAQDNLYPLQTSEVEPLQTALAMGLYWLADHLPGIGLVHAVWLFNVFISAAAGGVLFLYVLALGYTDRTAVIAALGFGFGTIIWPYSQTFFREPLALLLILLTAFFIERWRQSRYRSRRMLLGIVIAAAGAFLTKEAVIFAIPALLLLLPGMTLSPRQSRWLRWLVLIWVGIVVLILASIEIPALAGLTSWLRPLIPKNSRLVALFSGSTRQALHTYLLSIGGSVWGTSPLALLALPGGVLLFRRRQYRYIGFVSLIVLGFAYGYALLRGPHWFGGFSWPPRFLIPIVPFLILPGLPVIERVLERPVRRGLVALVGLLALYSVWVQLSGVTLPWGAYNSILPPESNGLGEWGGGLNQIAYLRWVMLPRLWAERPLNFAWVRTDAPLWAVMFAALFLISAAWMIRLVTRSGNMENIGTHSRAPFENKPRMAGVGDNVHHSRWRGLSLVWILPLVFVLALGLGLRLIANDPLYVPPSQDALLSLLPLLEAESAPDDVLLLNSNSYVPFFMNAGKINRPRIISLPDQPGEQASPEQPPQVVSTNPDDLLLPDSIALIHNLARTHRTVWLLADSGPWISYAVRPVERFMAAHFYLIREIQTDPPDATVRLLEYALTDAPDSSVFRGPDVQSDLQFGDSIRLTGLSLPSGTDHPAGGILPVSFYWRATAPVPQDYTVAWFLVDAGGNTVAQGMDSQPGSGFQPTSRWNPGVPVWDNRALRLPDTLQPGTYNLWVRVYTSLPDGTLDVLPVTGGIARDETIAVLPVTIQITAAP